MAKKEKSDAPAGKALSAECRVVIMRGPDGFRRQELTGQLKAMLEKSFGNVDVVHFTGADRPAAEILDECRSFGLIASHKLVVLDDADELIKEDTRPLFERYAAAPSDGATLVIRADSLPAGKLDKAVDAVGCVITCEPPNDAQAREWTLRQAKNVHKIELEDDAATLLVERVGPNLAGLDMEIAKLAVAAAGAKSINKALVQEYVGKSRDEEIWDIQSQLLTARPSERLEAVRKIMDVNRQPATLVLWAITDMAKKIHAVSRAIRAGQNPYQLKYAFKLFGDSADPIIEIAKQIEPTAALRLFRVCVEADRRTKSGLADADRAVEIATLRLPRPKNSAVQR
ncbi:MAG: DNA polymerase III subunit delta [Planctomycetes bacterium]|nr:DNA polymerase III subunit delta [Planctomycetota bacterium]